MMRVVASAILLSVVCAVKLGEHSGRKWFSFDCARPLLIYAEAKTGTSTIDVSFSKYCGMYIPLRRRLPQKSDWPRAIKCNGFREVCNGFLDRFAQEEVTVISMVRNPFERLMSLYFQVTIKSYFDAGKNVTLRDAEKEFAETLDRQHSGPGEASFWEDWQNNMNLSISSFKVDMYGRFQHFWKTRNGGRIYNILFLRLEDSDDWESVIRRQIPDLSLIPFNLGQTKVYLELYERFKRDFIWTNKEVDMVKERYGLVLDNLYTDKEKQDMLTSLHVHDDVTARLSREVHHMTLLENLAGLTRHSFGDALES